MAAPAMPLELVKQKLDDEELLGPRDAEGFPLDLALQRLTRRAAWLHALLCLYYLAVVPFVLKFVRFSGLDVMAQDLLLRASHLALLGGHLVFNGLLAVLVWNVLRMRSWMRWGVVVLSTAFTGWVLARIVITLWGIIAAGELSTAPLLLVTNCVLFCAYLYCVVRLMRSVVRVSVVRRELIALAEGNLRRE